MSEPQLLGTPIIRADFNAASQSGVLVASKRFLESTVEDLRPGVEILVRDWEGNSCRGVVTEVSGLAVSVELAWTTWLAEGDALVWVEGAEVVGRYQPPGPIVATAA
jgi:hypothetical protein